MTRFPAAALALGLLVAPAMASDPACGDLSFDKYCGSGDSFCKIHFLLPKGHEAILIDVNGNVYDGDGNIVMNCGKPSWNRPQNGLLKKDKKVVNPQ